MQAKSLDKGSPKILDLTGSTLNSNGRNSTIEADFFNTGTSTMGGRYPIAVQIWALLLGCKESSYSYLKGSTLLSLTEERVMSVFRRSISSICESVLKSNFS